MSFQISFADAWMGREAFYEGRVSCRRRENARCYQQLVRRYYSFLVPPGANVLEMGCGLGDLLEEIKPSHGVGVDFSAKTIALARVRHPTFEFQVGDATRWVPRKSEDREGAKLGADVSRFLNSPDYILLADLINDLRDVQAAFEHVRSLAHPRTRLVLNFLNTAWRPVLALAEWLGAKAPSLLQNWLSTSDVKNLLHLAGWEVVKKEHRILWPLRTPFLANFLNRWIAPLLPHCCLSIFLVARPRPGWAQASIPNSILANRSADSQPALGVYPREADGNTRRLVSEFSCSVIIPARNEAGNIEAAVLRTPALGLWTELIFVEGHSTDNTWQEAQRVARKYPQRNIKVILQRGGGKGDAVREGFAAARGDLLFILDADLTMPPEELSKFYEVARSGTAEFINGARLVYPMEHEAMRFLNMVANKTFGVAFSWLVGQHLKDTLCGTKVLFRSDYQRIAQNRAYFGEFDPFGDFDLLFGAARLNLRMVDLPIRYRARRYGKTNIRRWRHGWLLLRMVLFAARRLRFL